jgi:hypothetical protein
VAKQHIAPVTIDVQRVINMLEQDKCPASLGAFHYDNGDCGLVLLLAQPEYLDAINAFVKTLHDAAGYVSPVYDELGREVPRG